MRIVQRRHVAACVAAVRMATARHRRARTESARAIFEKSLRSVVAAPLLNSAIKAFALSAKSFGRQGLKTICRPSAASTRAACRPRLIANRVEAGRCLRAQYWPAGTTRQYPACCWDVPVAMAGRGGRLLYSDTARPMTAAFAGAPSAGLTVYGATPQCDAAAIGFQASTTVAAATQIYLRYDAISARAPTITR